MSWRLISNTANPDENPSASQTDTAWKDQEKTESGSHEGDLTGESSKDNSELYEKTNPVFNTAKTTLFQLAQQGNPYAAEISEKMGLTEDTQKSQSLSMAPEEEMTFRIILETRYNMMGSLALDSGFPVFVDLPCGYTPRPIEMAEQGVTYIGLDLPPVISEISDIIPSLISGEKQNLVRFCPADATNGESLEKALEDVKGSICINTEGLLMYLNDSETNSFLDNIRKLLSIHGGCWITADIEVMPEHNRILSAIHPGESSHDTSRILKEKADVGAEHNKLMVRYGNENEDIKRTEAILKEHGLKAERIRIAGYLADTKSFASLTKEQQDAVLKAVEDIAFWKMVPEGSAESSTETANSFTIHTEFKDGELDIRLAGRLDSLTAPQLLAKYEEQRESGDIRKVRIDCHSLDYISSAGLRVLLIMQKGCKEGVSFTGANEVVSDILIQAGFSDSLGIE